MKTRLVATLVLLAIITLLSLTVSGERPLAAAQSVIDPTSFTEQARLSTPSQALGNWNLVTSPTTTQLLGIDAVASNDVWAVGGEYGSSGVGIILHWNGSAWQIVPSPPTQVLRSISMISSNDGWAVGGYDVGVSNILHWNGTTWTSVPSPSNLWFSGVSAVSTNDVWAVGGGGVIAHWDGTSWSPASSPSRMNLNAITMLSSNDGWAVGNTNNSWPQGNSYVILHWNGTSWQAVPSPLPDGTAYYESVSMTTSSDGWIVGGRTFPPSNLLYGIILHWNGSTWTTVTSPTTQFLTSVSAVSSTDAWAVGGGILHWDGNVWSTVTNPTGLALNSVHMISAIDGWAVGLGGTILNYVPSVGSTFNISGRVTDNSGGSLSGVTISDGVGDTATTNTNGNYSLSGLAAGTYTITATLGGYLFAPPFLKVVVPPNATTQNFIGCPANVIPWTVMVYLDGDQSGNLSLDSVYSGVFNQYESAANNPCVNIVVAWDRSGNGKDAFYKVKYDTNPGQPANYTEGVDVWTQNPSELDMANPTTLSNFITWARTNFPAQHYALIISDHGTGLNGTALDSTTGSNAWLTIINLGNALATATSNGASKIDVIFADSCLMAMIEDAYQIQNYASYYVASENEIFFPPNGVPGPYTNYISSITASISPHDFANAIATQYANWMNNTYPALPYTISAVDLGQVGNVVSTTNSLASSLNSQMSTLASQISSARSATQKFDSTWDYVLDSQDQYVDLYDLATQISNRISDPTIQGETQAVMNATNGYVINNARHSGKYQGHTWNLDNSHGVSVFFPPNASSFYDATRYDFAVGAVWPGHAPARRQATLNVVTWEPMLVSYFQVTQPGGLDTPNPPSLVAPLVPPSSYFLPFIGK